MPPHAVYALALAGLTLGLPGAIAGQIPDQIRLQRDNRQLAGGAGATAGAGLDPSQLCRAAIAATERTTRIPDEFLSAIGRVESGRMGGGRLNPWPWTVNAAGTGHFYPTKQAAEDAVRQFQASGVKSLDVGCLQVNLFYHPGAFPSLDQAFDPAANAAFAAGMLLDLFQSTGSWPRAAAAYHSMTPALGQAYQQKVLETWATPDRPKAAGNTAGAEGPANLNASGGARQASERAPASAGAATAENKPMSQPAGPAPAGTLSPAPAFGFSRRFMLAQGQPSGSISTGRSLASYRAVPVQFAPHPPINPASLAR